MIPEPVTHYLNSKGVLVEIATMPQPHLMFARNKLVRDQIGDDRQDEIDAMSARLDVLDAERAAAEDAAEAAALDIAA